MNQATKHPMFIFFLEFWVFCIVISLAGCAKTPPTPRAPEPYSQYSQQQPKTEERHGLSEREVHGWLDNPDAFAALDSDDLEGTSRTKSFRSINGERSKPAMPESPGKKDAPHDTAKRMVHYQGQIKQRATDPLAVLDSAEKVVKKIGGYVESRNNSRIVLRVPVEKFHAAFDSLLKFGNVLDKSISATDITTSYQDNELRIKIAKSTIARLKELLKKAKKDEDKIKLLNEIQRISENLEKLESRSKTLKLMAAFSRITLEVIKHHPKSIRYSKEELEGFKWINALDPFKKDSRFRGKYLKFTVPKEMVKLKKGQSSNGWLFGGKRQWRTRSADGTEFSSRKFRNQPRGTTAFWLEAVEERLAPEFAESEVETAGDFKLLRLVSHDSEPYVYIVGVHARKKKLEVVEIYYPSKLQEKRYHPAIITSLIKGVL